MKIKSLEELIKIRESSLKKVNLRSHGDNTSEEIEVMVGMATCGIASGARETMNAILEEVHHQNLPNVKVVPVGCLGYCHSEPIVQVNIPGKDPILYGKVDAQKGREIITKHIMDGELLQDSIIHATFHRA